MYPLKIVIEKEEHFRIMDHMLDIYDQISCYLQIVWESVRNIVH